MKLAILAFTEKGAKAAIKVEGHLRKEGHMVSGYCFHKYVTGDLEAFYKLAPTIEKAFETMDAILFISAAGIAVRGIAPYVKSKVQDPAVLVMDERGNFVISLLSGHIGGANQLAEKIAGYIEGTPVITTATDVNQKLAIDVWATKRGLVIQEMELAKEVAARLLQEESVGYSCESRNGTKIKERFLCPEGLLDGKETKVGVCVTYNENDMPFLRTLHLIPKNLVLGIGCRKGKDPKELEQIVGQVLSEQKIATDAICKICSIDLKKKESALLQLSEKWNIPFETFTAEQLMGLSGEFTGSSFVQSITGVDNVCERSAILGSGKKEITIEKIVVKKQAVDGVTIAVAEIEG